MAGIKEGEAVADDEARAPRIVGRVHPMMNPLVVTNLFEVVPPAEMHRLRFICTEWYAASGLEFRTTETVQIGYEDGVLQWDNLNEKFDPTPQRPFHNFHLWGYEFLNPPYPKKPKKKSLHRAENWWCNYQEGINHPLMYQNMESFLPQYGSQIRRLKLSWSAIYNIQAFRTAIFKSLPNLVELALINVERKTLTRAAFDEDYSIGPVHLNLQRLTVSAFARQVPWKTLFYHYPNLKKLHLQPAQSPNGVSCVHQALQDLGPRCRMQVTSLTIDNKQNVCSGWDPLILPLIEMPHFKLENLEVDARLWEIGGQTVLLHIMYRHGTDLKKLSVRIFTPTVPIAGYNEINPIHCFPFVVDDLPNMEQLQLEGHACNSFNFMRQLPNLRKMVLSSCFPHMMERTDLQVLQNFTMLNLRVIEVDLYLPPQLMTLFFNMTSNVEEFKGDVSASTFRMICTNWRNLCKLNVSSGFMNQVEMDWVDNEAFTGIVAGVEERLPNITSLAGLQILSFKSRGEISDLSVWKGILELDHLKKITVNLGHRTTDLALFFLTYKFDEASGSVITRDDLEPDDED